MRVVWLLRYICGVCLLLALLASMITYHPDVEHLGLVLPAVFGSVGLLAGAVAIILGRLPPTHYIHQSKPFWAVLAAIAFMGTLLLVLAL